MKSTGRIVRVGTGRMKLIPKTKDVLRQKLSDGIGGPGIRVDI